MDIKLSNSFAGLGLVPTMGALHEGHISLVEEAQKANSHVMVSIFVNPTQFSKGEDFDKYPRTLDKDISLLKAAGVSSAFCPDIEVMYPKTKRLCSVEPHDLTNFSLEGKARPDFFSGVATVVTKLFNIIRPDVSYFGQKDIAQCVLLRRMVQDLNQAVDIEVCPTMRCPDGLALSSRNVYLTTDERIAAPVVYKAMKAGKDVIEAVDEYVNRATVIAAIEKVLWSEPYVRSIEYISIASHENMLELDEVHQRDTGAVISLAVRLCDPRDFTRNPKTMVRLIDNLLVGTAENIIGRVKHI
jgi:pantoate--beta-alanine ligase